jgi:hypothetical protein
MPRRLDRLQESPGRRPAAFPPDSLADLEALEALEALLDMTEEIILR